MAKWFGKIGYAVTTENPIGSGIWKEEITEKDYYGDLNRISRRLQSSDKVNDNVVISNELSILADPYAINNFHSMRYAKFMGTEWKITSVEVQYPRLILALGEVYTNGQ